MPLLIATAQPVLFHTSNITSALGVWNTTAGSNSLPSTPGLNSGNYYATDPPVAAIDGSMTTRYSNYGWGNNTYISVGSGVNTGLYWTTYSPQSPFLLTAFWFSAGADLPTRDPMIITIEGSNAAYVNLSQGSSWHLIYNGSSGLENCTTPGTWGPLKQVTNTVQYSSFRVLATEKRGSDAFVAFTEIQFFGYY